MKKFVVILALLFCHPSFASEFPRLLSLGAGQVLEWQATDEFFRLWNCNPDAEDSPFNLAGNGKWQEVVPHRRLLCIAPGLLFEWHNTTDDYCVWKLITREGPEIRLIARGKWPEISTGSELIALDEGRILGWQAATGQYHIWQWRLEHSSFVTSLLFSGKTTLLDHTSRMVYLGGNQLLGWEWQYGYYCLWDCTPGEDPFVSAPLGSGKNRPIRGSVDLLDLGENLVLDWEPQFGHFRILRYQRELGPLQPFAKDPLAEGNWPQSDADETIALGPVLGFPQLQSVYVWWHIRTPDGDHQVEYGTSEQLGSKVKLTQKTAYPWLQIKDLQPGQRYFYRVRSGKAVSAIRSFTHPNTSKTFRIGLWADNQEGYEIFSRHTIPVLQRHQPDLLLVPGDLVSEGNRYHHWPLHLYLPARDLLAKVPWFPVRGNHDGQSALAIQMCPFPESPHHYAYNCGPIRVVVINTNTRYGPDSEQIQWLKQELSSKAWSSAKYRLACFHHPPFTSLWDSPGHDGEALGRSTLVPLLEAAGVDIVLCGHAHCYERGQRQTRRGKVHYFIIGGGGGKLDTVKVWKWPHIIASHSRHHIAIADVTAEKIDFRAIDTITGEVFDEVTIMPRAGNN